VRRTAPPASDSPERIVPEYSSVNPLVRRIFFDRLRQACSVAQLRPTDIALDLGTGAGTLVSILDGKIPEFIGVDFHRMLNQVGTKIGKSKSAVHWIRSDAAHLPLRDGAVSVIFALDILEHVPKLEETLVQIGRVLGQGGRLVVSAPTESFLYRLARFVVKPGKGPGAGRHVQTAYSIVEAATKLFSLTTAVRIKFLVTLFMIFRFDKREP